MLVNPFFSIFFYGWIHRDIDHRFIMLNDCTEHLKFEFNFKSQSPCNTQCNLNPWKMFNNRKQLWDAEYPPNKSHFSFDSATLNLITCTLISQQRSINFGECLFFHFVCFLSFYLCVDVCFFFLYVLYFSFAFCDDSAVLYVTPSESACFITYTCTLLDANSRWAELRLTFCIYIYLYVFVHTAVNICYCELVTNEMLSTSAFVLLFRMKIFPMLIEWCSANTRRRFLFNDVAKIFFAIQICHHTHTSLSVL